MCEEANLEASSRTALPTDQSWVYVGEGRGAYEEVLTYRYVGEGNGSYQQGSPSTFKLRQFRCVGMRFLAVPLVTFLCTSALLLCIKLRHERMGAWPIHSEGDEVPDDALVFPSRRMTALVPPGVTFDCHIESDRWQTDWSELKKTFCCTSENIACNDVLADQAVAASAPIPQAIPSSIPSPVGSVMPTRASPAVGSQTILTPLPTPSDASSYGSSASDFVPEEETSEPETSALDLSWSNILLLSLGLCCCSCLSMPICMMWSQHKQSKKGSSREGRPEYGKNSTRPSPIESGFASGKAEPNPFIACLKGKTGQTKSMSGIWHTPFLTTVTQASQGEFRVTPGDLLLRTSKVRDDDNKVTRLVTLTGPTGLQFKGRQNVRCTRVTWDNGCTWSKTELDPRVDVRKHAANYLQAQPRSNDLNVRVMMFRYHPTDADANAGHPDERMHALGQDAADEGDRARKSGMFSNDQIGDVVDNAVDSLDGVPFVGGASGCFGACKPGSALRTLVSTPANAMNDALRAALMTFCSRPWVDLLDLVLNDDMNSSEKAKQLRVKLKVCFRDPLLHALNQWVDIPFVGEDSEEQFFRVLVDKVVETIIEISVHGLIDTGNA